MSVPAHASDAETVAFLQWAVPRLGLRWRGFRNVRGTVRKRLVRRMVALGLQSLDAYRERLLGDPGEWPVLEAMCRIPISRLYRDRAVFDRIAREILPERARAAEGAGRSAVRVWSAGCASGEEPYTLAIVWHFEVRPDHPSLTLELLATDADETMLARAERGVYAEGSMRELPAALRDAAFERDASADDLRVRDELRRYVAFRREDLRRTMPDGPFDLIACRNVAFTYFDDAAQRQVAAGLAERLREGGVLVIGGHESLPTGFETLSRRATSIYERRRPCA